ncbi:MAG: PASTA domain-containing protein [Treponema sp.]|nr:PASTA domain-containing protein [Treponema sp.]
MSKFVENLKDKGNNFLSSLNQNKKTFFFMVVFSVIFMFVICWITFFFTVRGPEQVMVPNIEGKELTTALLELQVKELYPKIQLKYTDNPDDAGKVLSQNPESGSIVKAGRRINLVISRGTILDHVENYIGQNYDDVKINLQTMFSGSSRPLIVLAEPGYKSDQSPAGTILAQDPPEGTIISSPVTVRLIVSKGAEYENARVPKLVGLGIKELLQTLSSSLVIFDFTSHIAEKGEKEGTVVNQEKDSSLFVPNYSRVEAEIALPKKQKDDTVIVLFTATLPSYPYAVEMTLEVSKDGVKKPVVTLKHKGGSVTIPYEAERESELVLSISERVVARQFVD